MSDVTVLSIDIIVSDPSIRRGRPIIAGTTLMVQDVAAHYRYRKYTPEELAAELQISLTQVFAALAYYFEHQAEIEAQLAADLEYGRQAKEQGLGQRNPPVL
jgi:uncharacterized protein (DUF433 family)